MAVEPRRACNYRKVGGLYLVGSGFPVDCDRLPLPITPCPTCGEEPRFSRNIARIDPLNLWGLHFGCDDKVTACPVCQPTERGWLMWVGSEYTPESFIAEARQLGVSKRIPAIPKDLKVGEDWVYLAYLHLIPGDNQLRLIADDSERGKRPGVFYAFRPRAIEKIVTQSQSEDTEAMLVLKDAGVTPVIVPDDDEDHWARKHKAKIGLITEESIKEFQEKGDSVESLEVMKGIG